jgi:hypothetical protein
VAACFSGGSSRDPLLIVGGVVLFALTGILHHGQLRLNKHGIHALTWRFLTGHP